MLGGHEVGSTALGQQVTQGAHGRTQKEGKWWQSRNMGILKVKYLWQNVAYGWTRELLCDKLDMVFICLCFSFLELKVNLY